MRLLHRDRHRHEDPSPTAETEPIDRIDDDTTRVEGDHLARDDRYDRDHLVERRDAPSTMPAAATDHDRTDDHMAADRADRADRAGVIDAADTVRPVRIRERSWAFAPGQLWSPSPP